MKSFVITDGDSNCFVVTGNNKNELDAAFRKACGTVYDPDNGTDIAVESGQIDWDEAEAEGLRTIITVCEEDEDEDYDLYIAPVQIF